MSTRCCGDNKEKLSTSIRSKYASDFCDDRKSALTQEGRQPGRDENQAALLIYDVFKGQTTQDVINLLSENNILVTKFPPNMTHLFQPPDLTVNKHAKDLTKKKFTEWFSRQIQIDLDRGEELENIDIAYRLTVIKPLHASWMVELYNHMSSDAGLKVVINGWKAAGIFDAVSMGSKTFRH